MTTLLSLRGIGKRYGRTVALDDVNLDVVEGEVHGVVGENGAGKSTLIGIAAGSVSPDSGSVEICGERVTTASPWAARDRGLALVSQHPALLADLSVLDNLLLVRRADQWPALRTRKRWAKEILGEVELDLDVDRLVADLAPSERALVEIGRALSLKPRVLILDEPTEPLTQDEVGLLFDRIRNVRAQGAGIVYISHRIPEILQIADRVTALRNGRIAGPTKKISAVSQDDIVAMIVGRELDSREVGSKAPVDTGAPVVLRAEGISLAPTLTNASLEVRAGEIVGLAGISGNGQEDLIRALAGLNHAKGVLEVDGKHVRLGSSKRSSDAGITYVSGDRQVEGIFAHLSVAKNIGLGAMRRTTVAGVVHPMREKQRVDHEVRALSIKTASTAAHVSSLSGGNAQKVVLARALEFEPKVLLADEPTSGVDVGSRSEIYDILRASAANGAGVVVLSTDAPELEAVCDRVLVYSRGHLTTELVGPDVRHEQISRSLLTTTQLRAGARAGSRRWPRLGTVLSKGVGTAFGGHYGAVRALLVLVVVLGMFGFNRNYQFLTSVNIASVLTFWTALVCISYGQQLVVMLGGIDLSVGPLTGLIAVVLSFKLGVVTHVGSVAFGVALALATGLAVGLLHFALVARLKISAVGVTLATYIALQGLSQVLRPTPGGLVDQRYIDAMTKSIGPLPVIAVVAAVLGVSLELWLRFTRLGTELRAYGSHPGTSDVLGVRSYRVQAVAYVGCALMSVLGGVIFVGIAGIGDALQGVEFTMSSVVAVVLGGAALAGGRGSFVGVMVGALILQETIALAPFLQLSQAWNTWFPGLLLVFAGLAFQLSRGGLRRSVRSA